VNRTRKDKDAKAAKKRPSAKDVGSDAASSGDSHDHDEDAAPAKDTRKRPAAAAALLAKPVSKRPAADVKLLVTIKLEKGDLKRSDLKRFTSKWYHAARLSASKLGHDDATCAAHGRAAFAKAKSLWLASGGH
jgi:hypothetical protein